jgi:hypothetical protein
MSDIEFCVPKAFLVFPAKYIGDGDGGVLGLVPLYSDTTFFDKLRVYTKRSIDLVRATSTIEAHERYVEEPGAPMPSRVHQRVRHHVVGEVGFHISPAMFVRHLVALRDGCDTDFDDLLYECTDVVTKQRARKRVSWAHVPVLVTTRDLVNAAYRKRLISNDVGFVDAYDVLRGFLDSAQAPDGYPVLSGVDACNLVLRPPCTTELSEKDSLEQRMKFSIVTHDDDAYMHTAGQLAVSFVQVFHDAFNTL